MKSRFSKCLFDPETRRVHYAVLGCYIDRYNGVDLAVHNYCEAGLIHGSPMYFDQSRWACSDPLTGCQMFTAAKGESRFEFEQNLRHKVIPAMEAEFKKPFAELVDSSRRKLLLAPHPSLVTAHIEPES